MEVEEIDAAEPRTDHDVGRIAGKAGAGDAVLHDLERFNHHGRQGGPVGCTKKLAADEPVGAEDAAPAAVEFILHAPRVIGGIRAMILDDGAASEIVSIEVDGDD